MRTIDYVRSNFIATTFADGRPAYLRGIRSLIVLAFFLVFLGVVYQASLILSSSVVADLKS